MWQNILRPLVCHYFFVRLKQFPVSFACWLLVFDIFWTTLTNSPRNNLTGHFLPKFWHILPEISSKEIFVLKGLMNKNFFHFLFFWAKLFPLEEIAEQNIDFFEVFLLSSSSSSSCLSLLISLPGPARYLWSLPGSDWAELWGEVKLVRESSGCVLLPCCRVAPGSQGVKCELLN